MPNLSLAQDRMQRAKDLYNFENISTACKYLHLYKATINAEEKAFEKECNDKAEEEAKAGKEAGKREWLKDEVHYLNHRGIQLKPRP